MPKKRIGRFELQQKLGAGGMGVVYEALDVERGKHIALKFLPPEFSDHRRRSARFERELEILKKLRHPNIVRCYGGMRYGNHRLFAMELVTGGSLKELLADRGRIPWEGVVEYGIQICQALAHAHEHGIIHRDIKPANILLTEDRQVKVTDFGIARDQDATALTAVGKTVGTLGYVAPEQIRADKSLSKQTDLYSLGCTLFEMLTGQLPFNAKDPAEMMFKHTQERPPRVSSLALDCPIWLDRLIGQLLEKAPNKRPCDAVMVANALKDVQDRVSARLSSLDYDATGKPKAKRGDGARGPARSRRKKRKSEEYVPIWERAWFLATCLILIIAGITWALWPLNVHQLHARAETLMRSDDPLDWFNAESKYIERLQEKDTEGIYEADVERWIDKIEMHRAHRRYELHVRFGKAPESEAERLYARAHEYEKNGDRVTAYRKYQSMLNLLDDSPEYRPFMKLAKRRMREIKQVEIGTEERFKIIARSLDRADRLQAEGKRSEAERIWQDIVILYGDNKELKPLVERARSKLEPENAQA
ncbi:MAG: serine/threonine protein kinase [Planctomycetota bacterium]